MTEDKKTLLIVDSNAVIHRAFHALPPLTTKKGELVNAIYGFLLAFFRAIKNFKPDYVAACFDLPAPTFRHKKFKEYKAKRPPAPKELYEQIPKVKDILRAFGVPVFEKEGYEADDLIGTIAKLAKRKQVFPEIETIILTGDLDTLQLVDRNTKVYTFSRGVKEAVMYDENAVSERFGSLKPSQLLDFKALKGDPSDNIPGVPGIGEKTAIKLIKEFGNVENLLKSKLVDYKEQVLFAKQLNEIKRDVPIELDLQKAKFGDYDRNKAIEVLKKFEFYSLINKLLGNDNLNRPEISNQKRLL